ncbi:signal peptidase I [Paenibacillaceae bacterium WGS1546]|uniref:signal peptidase I n=1 Tax=Cohnella sp. WGS1546 TaxID=3366810 RepID=UPI00372D058B
MRYPAVIFLVLVMALALIGCQEATLDDPRTPREHPIAERLDTDIVVQIHDDWMLGFVPYTFQPLVVDPRFYANNNMQRGDIVYFSHPETEDNRILRIVGLGGERIRMKQGQVYIDDKRLDAFYGKNLNDLRALGKQLKQSDLMAYEIENIQNVIRFVENENMDEILIPQDSVFLMGDNRGRAMDSVMLGPIPIDAIIGKVVGVLDEP